MEDTNTTGSACHWMMEKYCNARKALDKMKKNRDLMHKKKLRDEKLIKALNEKIKIMDQIIKDRNTSSQSFLGLENDKLLCDVKPSLKEQVAACEEMCSNVEKENVLLKQEINVLEERLILKDECHAADLERKLDELNKQIIQKEKCYTDKRAHFLSQLELKENQRFEGETGCNTKLNATFSNGDRKNP